MTILVTGAAGFIGSHLCVQLLGRGDSVIGVDNLNNYYDVSLKRARLSLLGGNEKKISDTDNFLNDLNSFFKIFYILL